MIKCQSRTVLSSVLLSLCVTCGLTCDLTCDLWSDLWPGLWPVTCNLTCDLTCDLQFSPAGPRWINRVKLLTLYMCYTLFSGYHFIVFLFHHPLTCTSQGVWMWISARSHRRKWVNTRLPCFHLPSCKSAGWSCWNYRWECSLCRVRVWVTHRSWLTWSSSWRNVAGRSRRMIRENTKFPLDAILKEKKKRPFPSPTRIWQISVSDPATWLG